MTAIKDSQIVFVLQSGGVAHAMNQDCMYIIYMYAVTVLSPPPRFAFNAGSAESISGKAVHSAVGRIALVMCLGCASAGIVQTIISGLVQIYKRDETFNSNEIANAVLGALVSVTGCCTFIDPPWAILIGGNSTTLVPTPSPFIPTSQYL